MSLSSDNSNAILVRSKNSAEYIEWETEAIPTNYKKDTAVFFMLAGIDVTTDYTTFHLLRGTPLAKTSYTYS